MYKAFDVALVSLDPVIGSEIRKTRPCVIISPDAMNRHLRTVIIAPMTSKGFGANFRAPVSHDGIDGFILLDQIRSIDKSRIVKMLGSVDKKTIKSVKIILAEMFA